MKQLRFSTIDLFLYDLDNSFGNTETEFEDRFSRFSKRISNLSDGELVTLKKTQSTFSNYIELLGPQRIKEFAYPLDGYYYPVKLGDTYAVQIDCSGKRDDSDWQKQPPEEKLRQTKNFILEKTNEIRGELGENWLIWGQIEEPSHQDRDQAIEEYTQIAKECYKAVQVVDVPQWEADFKGYGELRGAFLFELEQPEYIADGINRNQHILICLFPKEKTKEEIADIVGGLYRSMIRLFHYRNKVLWAYEQGHQLKDALKSASSTTQKLSQALARQIKNSNIDISKLQINLADALSISHYYETSLGYLQEQISTIETNTNNYKNRVQEIANLDDQADLKFLDRFASFAEETCLAQVKTDYQALHAGLQPLENFIKTVQGITELERTKNDQVFNRTVAIATVGVSTASLAASFLGNQADALVKAVLPVPTNRPTPPLNTWMNFILPFSLSIAIGVVCAVITKVWLDKISKKY